MNETDILLPAGPGRFSLRVGGICLRAGKVLLHVSSDGTGYSIPGGHVNFGEDTRTALRREFQEELGVQVNVGELKWLGENFFPMRDKPCHQICFYYHIYLKASDLPEDSFQGIEEGGETARALQFRWVPLAELGSINLYPANCVDLLVGHSNGLEHFLFREGEEQEG